MAMTVFQIKLLHRLTYFELEYIIKYDISLAYAMTHSMPWHYMVAIKSVDLSHAATHASNS